MSSWTEKRVPIRRDATKAAATRGRAHRDFDRATLRPDALPVIQDVIAVMKAEPELRLEVDGDTDSIGSGDYNQSLSEARAKAVMVSLVAGGIQATRLTSAGFGASKPVADSATGEGRAENRRVELVRQ